MVGYLHAAKRNNFPIVSGLLEFGANPNGRKGWPLIYAARNDNRDMVDLLLGNGASAAALNSESLLESAFNQNLMMTETLIRHGAKASMRHSLPLYWAALHGNVHLAQLLIRHGARFDEWWWNGSQIFQRLSLTELGIISRNPDDNSDEIYKDMHFSHVSDRIKDLAVV